MVECAILRHFKALQDFWNFELCRCAAQNVSILWNGVGGGGHDEFYPVLREGGGGHNKF